VMLVKVPFEVPVADRAVPNQDTGRKKPKTDNAAGKRPAALRGGDL